VSQPGGVGGWGGGTTALAQPCSSVHPSLATEGGTRSVESRIAPDARCIPSGDAERANCVPLELGIVWEAFQHSTQSAILVPPGAFFLSSGEKGSVFGGGSKVELLGHSTLLSEPPVLVTARTLVGRDPPPSRARRGLRERVGQLEDRFLPPPASWRCCSSALKGQGGAAVSEPIRCLPRRLFAFMFSMRMAFAFSNISRPWLHRDPVTRRGEPLGKATGP